MSQENVEVVRRAWDAWRSGDIDAVVAICDPEMVWDMTNFRDWPDAVYRGREGFRRFIEEWLDVWESFETDLDEIRLAPDGRVVVLAWQRGEGRASGLGMQMEWAQVISVADGMILRNDNYDERSKALEAAGLSE